MQMAAMVGPSGPVYAFEPFDAERRPARTIDRRKPVRRSRGLRARRRRRARRHGDADVSAGDAELRRRVPAARRHRPARRKPHERRAGRRARRVVTQRPVRFIKMDVEGAEPQVMRGARRLLREDRADDSLRAAPDAARARVRHHGRRVPARRSASSATARTYFENGGPGAVIERPPQETLTSIVLCRSAKASRSFVARRPSAKPLGERSMRSFQLEFRPCDQPSSSCPRPADKRGDHPRSVGRDRHRRRDDHRR